MYLFFFQIIFPSGLFQSLFDIPLCSLTAPPPQLAYTLGANTCPGANSCPTRWEAAGNLAMGTGAGGGGPSLALARLAPRGSLTALPLGWCRCGAGVVVRLECWPGTSTEGGGRRVAAAESPGLWGLSSPLLQTPVPAQVRPLSPAFVEGHRGNASCFWALSCSLCRGHFIPSVSSYTRWLCLNSGDSVG